MGWSRKLSLRRCHLRGHLSLLVLGKLRARLRVQHTFLLGGEDPENSLAKVEPGGEGRGQCRAG